MLTDDDRARVELRLLDVLAYGGSPRQTIATWLRKDLATLLPFVGTPVDLVREALKLVIADAYSDSPPALVVLLEGIFPDDAEIKALIALVRNPPPLSNDPFDATILFTKLPFLGRKQTRSYLKALMAPIPPQPVVVIVGESDLGKTYTFEFIDHVAAAFPEIQHCRIEVAESQGSSIGPRELAGQMVASFGGNSRDCPALDTNIEAWTRAVSNWVVSEAARSGSNWWIVLDGFTQRELRDDTRQFIVKLALALTTGLAQRRHRLIFLDFDRTVLPLQPGRIAVDVVGGIPHGTVRASIVEIVAASKKKIDSTVISTRLLEGFADPVTDLPELNRRLRDFIGVIET